MASYHPSLDNDMTSANASFLMFRKSRKHPFFNFLEELQVLRSWVIWKRGLNHHFLGFLFNRELLVLCAKSLDSIFFCQKVKYLKLVARNTADCTLVCMHIRAYEHIYVSIFCVLHCSSESTFVGDARVAMVVTYF